MLIFVLPALAGSGLLGDQVILSYNDAGTWNDSAVAHGFQAKLDDAWVEFTYAGYAFQLVGASYTAEGESFDYYSAASAGQNMVVSNTEDISTDSMLGRSFTFSTANLDITKTESFALDGTVVSVAISLENTGEVELSDVKFIYSLDPDQETAISTDSSYYSTANDTMDLDGDGQSDWAQSAGFESGYTIGIGACTPDVFSLGHYADWSSNATTTVTLTDDEGALSDSAMGILYHTPIPLAAGETRGFSFIISVAPTAAGAAAAFSENPDVCCDGDGDGADNEACGGGDCDDANPELNPESEDIAYDGIDQNCDGTDANDLDADGQIATEAGGGDCDDADATIGPGIAEIWYDGIDQDCDGNDDDQDGDGYVLAYDCDDTDPAFYTGCPEDKGDVNTDKGGDGVDASTGCDCDGGNGPAAISGILMAVGGLRRRRPRPRPRMRVLPSHATAERNS